MRGVEVTLVWQMDVPDDWANQFIITSAEDMLEYATQDAKGPGDELDVRQVRVDVRALFSALDLVEEEVRMKQELKP